MSTGRDAGGGDHDGDGGRLATDHVAAHDMIRLRPRADRVVLAYGDTVLSSATDGRIEPVEEGGLFVHETRMISQYAIRVGGRRRGIGAWDRAGTDRAVVAGMQVLPRDRGGFGALG